MSYIRTKDGIYILSEAYWAGNKDEVIAQADTIEELCDEFVLVISDKIHQIILGETTFKDEIKIIKHNKLHKIYGAIWTSKGLIYVAKMNSDGVLELI